MAFGYESKEVTKECIRMDELKDIAVIASFKPNGEVRPLKVKMKTELDEYIAFDIFKILYTSYNGIDMVTNISFGVELQSYKKTTIELIYIVEIHQWKIKYIN